MVQEASRFVVGIDLGTTHSAVCYIDTADARWQVHTLAIPQLVAPSERSLISQVRSLALLCSRRRLVRRPSSRPRRP